MQLEFIAVRHRATSSRRQQVAGEGRERVSVWVFLAGSLTCFVPCLGVIRTGSAGVGSGISLTAQLGSWRRGMHGRLSSLATPRCCRLPVPTTGRGRSFLLVGNTPHAPRGLRPNLIGKRAAGIARRDRPNLIIWHVKKIKKDSDDSNPCGHDAATVRSTMCRAKLRSRFCLKCKLLPAPATDATGVRPESPERRAGAGDTQPVIV